MLSINIHIHVVLYHHFFTNDVNRYVHSISIIYIVQYSLDIIIILDDLIINFSVLYIKHYS